VNHLDNGALHHEQHLTVDVWIVVCDGLTGPPDAIAATWPLAIAKACVLLNPFKLASRRDWDAMAGELRPIYTDREAAKERLGEFHQQWGETYPAIIFLWTNA
jgi:transposase-like protein